MLSRQTLRTSNLPVSKTQSLPNLSVTKCPDIHATLSFIVTERLTVAPLSIQPHQPLSHILLLKVRLRIIVGLPSEPFNQTDYKQED